MTTTHSSAVEAAEREKLMNAIENYAQNYALVGEGTKRKMRAELETALRAALTRPQEVAAPVGEADMLQVIDERDSYHEVADDLAAQIAAITGQEIGEHSSANDPWRNAMLAADEFIAQQLRDMVVAASRVPVASPAEPVPLSGDLVIKALLAMDAEARKRGEMFPQTADEQERDTKAVRNVIESLEFYTTGNQCRNGRPSVKNWPNLPATPPVGAGGAGVMDARPDSVHSDSGECDRVQRVELSGDELALFQQTLEDFADCGETETDYEVLVNWAQRGLLECINFQPTAAAHRMLSSITSTDQKGNAA